MIKILTYAPAIGDGTSFYRLAGVMPYLEQEYSDIKVTDISNNKYIDWYNLVGADILLFQRPFSEQHFAAIKMARNMNIKVVIDYDDDLFNIPQDNPVHLSFEDCKETMKLICQVVDEIWVSTDAIKKTVTSDNAVLLLIFGGASVKEGTVTVFQTAKGSGKSDESKAAASAAQEAERKKKNAEKKSTINVPINKKV
jgi:hypothetical protein